MPDNMNLGEIEHLKKLQIKLRKVGNLFQPGRSFGATVSRMIRRDHIEPVCELGQKRKPARQAASAMEKEQRLPGAAAPHKYPAVAYIDE